MKKIIIAAVAFVASCATSAAQIYLWNGGEIEKGFETPNYIDSLTFEHKEKWYETWYGPDDIRKVLSEWNEMYLWKNNSILFTSWPDSVSFSYIDLDKYSTPTTSDLVNKYESVYDPMYWYDWNGFQYNPLNVISGIMTNDFYVGGAFKNDMRDWNKMAGLSADAVNNISSVWDISYEGIMRANVIERLVDDEDYELTDDERMLYKAEANFLRNFYYSIIWKWWGNIPYSKTATSNETLYNAPQCDATTVGDNIAADLETIIESDVLPMRWENAKSGRISKAAAIMLYTDVIMYNTASDNFADNKKKAKDYLLQIVNSGEYSLNPDYAALWEESGEWCAESIFEVNYDDNNERGWGSPLAKGGTVLPKLISPTDIGYYADSGWGFFPMRVSTLNMYKLSDARRDATCWDVQGVEYQERYQDTHVWLKKYRAQSANNVCTRGDSEMNYNNNLRIYRYAETLLWLSELTGDAKYMNMVRNRAGLADTEYSLEAVIEERHLEFVGENKRYWDLIRTGMAATELKANVDDIDDREYDWTEQDNKYLLIPESAMETAKIYGNPLKQNNPCPYDMSKILEGSSFNVTKDNSLIILSADCSPLNERYYIVDKDGNETLVADGQYLCPEAGKYTFRLYANYRDIINSEDYVERSIVLSEADIEADAIYAKDYEDVIKVSKKYNQITAECSDESVTVMLYKDDYDYDYGSSLTLSRGEHTIKVYVSSSKGVVSKDYLEYEFTVSEEDLLADDIDRYMDRLANKTWRIDNQEYGHLGCGPSGTDGMEWWSAEDNDKADYGVYDDRITFERGDQFDEGAFTYDPGAGGTVYVNHGCQDALFAEATMNGTAYEDVMVEVEKQTSTFAIVTGLYRGETHLYLQLAPNTLMPYISGDEAYNNPLYRIESLTNQRLELVCDYGEIAWRMVFTSEEPEEEIEWGLR